MKLMKSYWSCLKTEQKQQLSEYRVIQGAFILLACAVSLARRDRASSAKHAAYADHEAAFTFPNCPHRFCGKQNARKA